MELTHSIECWIARQHVSCQQEILLLRVPSGDTYPSFFQPITGGIEAGERAEAACIREVREETGLQVTDRDIVRRPGYFDLEIGNKGAIIRKRLFYCDLGDSLKPIRLSDEHEAFQWAPIVEVDDLLHWESNRETFRLIQSHIVSSR